VFQCGLSCCVWSVGFHSGDEVVTVDRESPNRLIERITTQGDSWNECSPADAPHPVGLKTNLDSPPCVACDFTRRRKHAIGTRHRCGRSRCSELATVDQICGDPGAPSWRQLIKSVEIPCQAPKLGTLVRQRLLHRASRAKSA
jgi:hypothetical protein